MSVPDGAMLSEDEFDALVEIVPKLSAKQLWNVAATFGRRIVALDEGGATPGGSDTDRADEHEDVMGFRPNVVVSD